MRGIRPSSDYGDRNQRLETFFYRVKKNIFKIFSPKQKNEWVFTVQDTLKSAVKVYENSEMVKKKCITLLKPIVHNKKVSNPIVHKHIS